MSSVVIRPAAAGDLPALRAMSVELTAFDRAWDDTLVADWPLGPEGGAYLEACLAGDGHAAWVAEAGGRVVGMLTAGEAETPGHRSCGMIAELETLWVEPAHRGGGAGRALVEAFLAWARGRGLARQTVRVSAGNAAAIRFYAGLGFAPYDAILERVEPATPFLP